MTFQRACAPQDVSENASEHHRHASEGQVAIIFALLLLVLIGFVALSIDGGYVMAERRQTQSAADAGALAAAKALLDEKGAAAVTAAGQTYAMTNAGSGSSAVVSNPPASGTYAGNALYVQVSVTKPVRKFFVGAVYSGDWTVTATATAGIEPELADYALITLEQDDEDGIYMNGNTGIVLTGGNASAMSNTNIRGSSNTTFTAPGTIDAHTTIASGGSWSATRAGKPQVDDPLSWMTSPSKGTARTFCSAPCTTSAGWYKNQTLTLNKTMTLAPGVYYLENTNITIMNNGLLTGTGVTLYFDATSAIDPKNGSLVLTGPNSAPWSGARAHLVFWHTACNIVDIQGNGDVSFTGIFYAPCAHVSMHGNPSNDTVIGQILVGTLEVKGTSDLKLTYQQYVDTQRDRVFLVE